MAKFQKTGRKVSGGANRRQTSATLPAHGRGASARCHSAHGASREGRHAHGSRAEVGLSEDACAETVRSISPTPHLIARPRWGADDIK